MTLQARSRALRSALTCPLMAAVFLQIVFLTPIPSAAAEQGLAIELNQADTIDRVCRGTFVLKNSLGHTLDRFQLDLFIFGVDGVILQRSNIDLAPLRRDKTTVIAFPVVAKPCADIARILVNDIPRCRSEAGQKLDCLDGLTVSSRHRIKLEK